MSIEPRSAQWANEPEPPVPQLDPQTILDTQAATADGYIWNARNCQEEWLQFEGELLPVEQ